MNWKRNRFATLKMESFLLYSNFERLAGLVKRKPNQQIKIKKKNQSAHTVSMFRVDY